MLKLSIVTTAAILCVSMLYPGSAVAQTTQPGSTVPPGINEHSGKPQDQPIDDRAAPSLQQVLKTLNHQKDNKKTNGVRNTHENAAALDQSRRTPPLHSGSKESHSLELLSIGAEEYVRMEHNGAQRVVVSLTPIDRRLRLKRCEENPEYTWTSAAKRMGNTTITVRCDDSAPWKILIRAHVSVYDYIPVLSVPVSKGDLLSADMVTPQLLDVSSLRNETIRDIEKVVGYRFKRRLAAGREISSSVLATPKVIAKGDLVQINASNRLLDIQMKGTALAGGEVGRKINVRSNSSGRVIQTWIKGPGQVMVSP